jgi:capsular exopolysaccharide synthesis family protein
MPDQPEKGDHAPTLGPPTALAVDDREGRASAAPSPFAPSGLPLEDVNASSALPGVSLHAFLRHKWLILVVFLLCSAAMVPPILLLVRPQYLAVASVRIRPSIPRILFNVPEKNGMVPFYHKYVNTQVATMRSKAVLQEVFQREDVQSTAWYQEKPQTIKTMLGGSPPSRFERLAEALTVGARRDTELIDVAVKTYHPADARVLANAIVDEYKVCSDLELGEHEDLVFRTLRDQKRLLGEEIDELVERQGTVSKKIGTGDPDIVRSQLAARLGELETRRDELHRSYTIARDELESIPEMPDAAEARADDTKTRYMVDPDWRALMRDETEKRHHLERTELAYGEASPQIAQARLDLRHAEELRRNREMELDTVGPETLQAQPGVASDLALGPRDRQTLERLTRAQERELELLDKRIEELRIHQEGKGELAKQLAKIEQELRDKRDLHESFRLRLQSLEIEEKAPGRISVASYAIEPTSPHTDRRFLLTLMAIGSAAAMAAGMAFLRISTDTKVRDVGDVQGVARVPFLGQLPPLPKRRDLLADGSPMLQQNVRMVRTALLERLGSRGKNVVLITSSTSEAGKSSLSILLSRSLASLGKKVLLVEADIYRPSLGERLGIDADTGLASLLCGTADDRKAIRPVGVENLEVILVGDAPSAFHEQDLLADGVFSKCLARWKKRYDYVIMDGPPVLPVADARILTNQVDGTILVLRASHCRRDEVVRTYADLSAAGGRLLGTVLVGARPGPGYGYYSGRYTYYQPAEKLPSKS